MREQARKHQLVMRCSDPWRKPRDLRRNDVGAKDLGFWLLSNRMWQAGGKAKFIYLPPGLMLALVKSLLIDLELLTDNAEEDRAQAAERWAA